MVLLIRLRSRLPYLALLLIAAQGMVFAQSASEYEVKAAFIYKFAGFVQWPEDSGRGSICIGVVGQDPFGTVLDEVVRGKSMNGRTFTVRRFRSRPELPDCQIVFIAASERARLRQTLAHLPPAVLTVGDMPGFCESGGMIGFDLADHRVRLRINPEAAQKARLQISSKLLSLARLVGDGME